MAAWPPRSSRVFPRCGDAPGMGSNRASRSTSVDFWLCGCSTDASALEKHEHLMPVVAAEAAGTASLLRTGVCVYRPFG
jgi:hypothetical protein